MSKPTVPSHVAAFLEKHRIREVECLVPDLNGYPRGKVLPAAAFAAGQELRVARAVAIHTVVGDFPDYRVYGERDPDMRLVPDYERLHLVPWAAGGRRALAIHDCHDLDGTLTPIASRSVLKTVLKRYADLGWQPVVAPELEFYVLAPNPDPSQPLTPPAARCGRTEIGHSAFSFGALNEFADFFDDLHGALDKLGIHGDTFVHELGPSQFEINLKHDDALELADQTFLFKYALRETGLKHGLYVVCMAKPIAGAPGSSMHIHQSLVDLKNGRNLFSQADGEDSPLFRHYIAGLQTCLPSLMPLMAPYVNSYRRFTKNMAAPVNLSWGLDNRSVGLRVPLSGPEARRIENRLPGCDANPYLALAASLAAGLYGIENELEPTAPAEGNVFYRDDRPELPRSLDSALERMASSDIPGKLLGDEFAAAFIAAKEVELESYLLEVTPWERRYLATQA
ncbi:glutamine synthetase family protein [Crenobacter sp. SG2303]|uniref:Glutamine synthetase family protein n=1 Tax=Crenobacter oryzisoli TaxID=3056844 RepID=A0ABT7XT90_9NEIS|nr:glutamine synthetase family protein [Crenobacter sp. SG2303]MDN0076943.1 glutamine synthetase family protein [Crenobacter sp. SG2303]